MDEHDLLIRTIIWKEKGELVAPGKYGGRIYHSMEDEGER